MTPLPHTDTYQPVLLQGRQLMWVRYGEEAEIGTRRLEVRAGVVTTRFRRSGVALATLRRNGVVR